MNFGLNSEPSVEVISGAQTETVKNDCGIEQKDTGRGIFDDDSKKCAICLVIPQKDPSLPGGCLAQGKHLFCFICLREWFKAKPSCPMCNGESTFIRHKLDENDGYGEIVPLSTMKKEFAAEIIASRSEDTPLTDEEAALTIYYRKLKTKLNCQFDDVDATSRNGSYRNRNYEERVKELRRKIVEVINRVKFLRESISNGTMNRSTLVADSVFRMMILEEKLVRSDLSGNDQRRPFTVQIARDEISDVSRRLTPWLKRDLTLLVGDNAHNVYHVDRVIRTVIDATTQYAINSPQFEAVVRGEGVPAWALESFCNQLFDFASSNLPMNLHDNNSQFRHPDQRRDTQRNNNRARIAAAEVINLDDSANPIHDNDDILLVSDSDQQNMRRNPYSMSLSGSLETVPSYPRTITALDSFGVRVPPRSLADIFNMHLPSPHPAPSSGQLGSSSHPSSSIVQSGNFVNDDVVTLSSDEEGRRKVDEIRRVCGAVHDIPKKREPSKPRSIWVPLKHKRCEENSKDNKKRLRRASYSRSETDTEEEEDRFIRKTQLPSTSHILVEPLTSVREISACSTSRAIVSSQPHTISYHSTSERSNSRSPGTPLNLMDEGTNGQVHPVYRVRSEDVISHFKKRIQTALQPRIKERIKTKILNDMRAHVNDLVSYIHEVEQLQTYEEHQKRFQSERTTNSDFSNKNDSHNIFNEERKRRGNERARPNYRDESFSGSGSEDEYSTKKRKSTKVEKRKHQRKSKKVKKSKDESSYEKSLEETRPSISNEEEENNDFPNKIKEAEELSLITEESKPGSSQEHTTHSPIHSEELNSSMNLSMEENCGVNETTEYLSTSVENMDGSNSGCEERSTSDSVLIVDTARNNRTVIS